jgi:hypothetical protein
LLKKFDRMSTTTIYIIVAISLLHFVVAIVFLLRKLGGPPKDASAEKGGLMKDGK